MASGEEVATLLKLERGGTSASLNAPFNLDTASPLLAKYATIYESYKIKSVSYRFVTDESTQTSGNISMGIDYGKAESTALTRDQICKLNPYYSGPIRATTNWITVSPVFLDTNAVRYVGDSSTTSIPFSLAVTATATSADYERTLGSIHIRYTIQFLGIRP